MIPITKPVLGDEETRAIAETLATGWVAQGPRVAQFESAVAEYCGAPHAVAVSSCTAALHLALIVSEVGPGAEVVCPSMSFIATANAITYCGADVVFADVDRRTYNLDPAAVQRAISPRTKAILIVHQMGLPAEMDAFEQIARQHKVSLIEDAACALGSRYRSRPVGGDGRLTCFSFHPRKVITTGEGGMILTADPDQAKQLRLLREHGMSVPASDRHGVGRNVIERYVRLGYNYRLSDIQAAVGVAQMKRLDALVNKRREIARRFNAALDGHPWIETPFAPEYATSNYQSYSIQLTDACPLSTTQFAQELLEMNVSTRRGIMLSHRESPHVGVATDEDLPDSCQASDRSLLLPLYPTMTEMEQQMVLDAIARITRQTTSALG